MEHHPEALKGLNPYEIGEAVKLRCFGLYLTGMSPQQIEGDVGVPARIVRLWAKHEDWDAERETARLRSKEILRDDAALEIVGTQARHLKLSRALQGIVEAELDKYISEARTKPFRSWAELTQVLDRAITIERDALIGTVEEDLVLRIIQVIKDNVADDETKQKLAQGIKALLGSGTN